MVAVRRSLIGLPLTRPPAPIADEFVTTRAEVLPEYTHFAFTVDQSEFAKVSKKLNENEIKIWKENKSEGDSIYFLDPDGHKLEIHVGNRKSRLASVKKNPWEKGIEFFE